MKPEQLEKIKALIASSKILSPAERSEWMALLELMDDKQLGELEKILNSAKPKIAFNELPKTINPIQPSGVLNRPSVNEDLHLEKINSALKQPLEQKKPDSEKKVENTAAKIPKLSHLVNIPRFDEHEKKPDPLKNSISNLNVLKTEEEAKKVSAKTSGFLTKLKNILSEKELPEGRINPAVVEDKKRTFKIEKPAEIKKQEPVVESLKKQPPIVPQPPKIVIAQNAVIQGPVTLAGNSAANSLKPTLENTQEKPKTVTAEQNSKILSKQKPVSAGSALNSQKIDQLLKQELGKQSPAQNPASGVAFKQTSQKENEDLIKQIKDQQELRRSYALVEDEHPENVNPGIKGNISLKLETLEDLEALNVKGLNSSDFSLVVKNLRSMIMHLGYHEVIFRIEKSPLYKAYIKTGWQILDKQETFEVLGTRQQEGYLDRRSFELCADLLRQIQAG